MKFLKVVFLHNLVSSKYNLAIQEILYPRYLILSKLYDTFDRYRE